MRRLTTVAIISAVAMLVLDFVDGIERNFPMKPELHHTLPHLVLVASAVLIGALLMFILEETARQHLIPAIREGFEGLGTNVRGQCRVS